MCGSSHVPELRTWNDTIKEAEVNLIKVIFFFFKLTWLMNWTEFSAAKSGIAIICMITA